MTKNILYSVFLHLALFLLAYNAINKIEVKKSPKISETYITLEKLPEVKAPQIIEEKVEKKITKPKKIIRKPKKKKSKKKKLKKKIKKVKKPKKKIPKKPKPKKKIKKITPKKPQEIIDELDDLRLSARQKFNIQSQLNSCFQKALNHKNITKKVEFSVKLKLLKNGSISFDKEKNIDQKRYSSDPNYKKIFDAITLAMSSCGSFRNLEKNKYEIWKEFKVTFKNRS